MERKTMVRTHNQARGVRNPVVLDAMRSVERHRFVPETERAAAYEDHPSPSGTVKPSPSLTSLP